MVPLTHVSRPPRWLLRLWIVMLLAPIAWASALGMLFSLTDDSCRSGTRAAMWAVAVVCLVLATLPAVIAWHWRDQVSPATAAGERAMFMINVAIGGSVLFTLVTLLTAVPIWFLDPCRT